MRKKRSKDGRPERVGQLLGGTRFRGKMDLMIEMYKIQKHWPDLVGKMMAGRSFPKTIRNKVLHVAVENPAWAQQFIYLKADILQGLSQRLQLSLKDIQFTTEQPHLYHQKISQLWQESESDQTHEAPLDRPVSADKDRRSLPEVLEDILKKVSQQSDAKDA